VSGAFGSSKMVEVEIEKHLKIGYKKTCSCSDKKISCVNGKEWVKGMVTIQAFYYNGRDIRDKDVHPAVFPISLPSHFINLLTHKGELVIDPFVGVGTTLIASKDLDRNAVGFDLNKKYLEVANQRLAQSTLVSKSQQMAICDESHNIPQYLKENTVSLCITSPPYAMMLNRPRLNKSMRADTRENKHFKKVQQYSNNPLDLGTMNHEAYAKALEEIYRGILPLMKPKAHCIINVNDVWWENKRYITHIYVIEALQRAGFEFRNTFIWDKRDLVNRVGIFGYPNNFISMGSTMEFILDFWKPPSKIASQ
jgi:DNA modification methylase